MISTLIIFTVLVLYMLFTHFVSDFIMQTDEMAKGKSTSIKWLTLHILMYGLVMLGFLSPLLLVGFIFSLKLVLVVLGYIIVNMILHWITDYFTSRQTKRLFEAQKIHEFFVVIGLDQYIHTFCLLTTLLGAIYILF